SGERRVGEKGICEGGAAAWKKKTGKFGAGASGRGAHRPRRQEGAIGIGADHHDAGVSGGPANGPAGAVPRPRRAARGRRSGRSWWTARRGWGRKRWGLTGSAGGPAVAVRAIMAPAPASE